jgi:cyclic-di-GMP-binding biofilm dispersal mediator protein
MTKRNLEGASVIVAGVSGVLGFEIARRLIKEGADVTLFGRDAQKLSAVDLPGPRVIGDLADSEACDRAATAAIAEYGKLDGIVNAAGVVAFGPIDSLDDGSIDELLTTNFLGPLRLMRAALPDIEAGGFIANLSAVVAEHPVAGMAVYSATKAALTALDRALARELRRRKIDVLDVRPPHTETGLANRAISGAPPSLAEGKNPESVAHRIVQAIQNRERDLASSDF